MKAKQLVLAALFCALMVVGAYLHIPMPVIGSITLQTLFCFLCALLLPPSSALLAMGAYLLLGLVGLPVFTFGGGLGSFAQVTFGFILGFAVATPVGSFLYRRLQPGLKPWLAAVLTGLCEIAIIDILGAAYGYVLLNVYLGRAMDVWSVLWNFCLLFLPVDLLKLAVAVPVALRVQRRLRWR